MALCGSLLDMLPDDWFAAQLELEVTSEGTAHSIRNPDGHRDIVMPSDDLYAKTFRLQGLFQQCECMFRRAVFDLWWDDTEETWRFAVEHSYDQEE